MSFSSLRNLYAFTFGIGLRISFLIFRSGAPFRVLSFYLIWHQNWSQRKQFFLAFSVVKNQTNIFRILFCILDHKNIRHFTVAQYGRFVSWREPRNFPRCHSLILHSRYIFYRISGPSDSVFSRKKLNWEISPLVSKIRLPFCSTRCQYLMGSLSIIFNAPSVAQRQNLMHFLIFDLEWQIIKQSHIGKGLWDPLSIQPSPLRGSQEFRDSFQNDKCKKI